MRRRFPSLTVAALCAVSCTVSLAPAVTGAQSADPPAMQITPGTRVQFVDPWHQGATVQGQITRRWGDSVTVHEDGEPAPADFRLADLHALSVSEGRSVSGANVGRGALYGAIGSAVLGGVLLNFMHHEQSAEKHPKGLGLEVGIATAFGAVAGAIGGALHTPERWRSVIPR